MKAEDERGNIWSYKCECKSSDVRQLQQADGCVCFREVVMSCVYVMLCVCVCLCVYACQDLGDVVPPRARPDLEAGKQLPRIFAEIPSHLVGVPLEDIDQYYFKDKRVGDPERERERECVCVCVSVCVCVCACLTIFVGSKKQESSILVGSRQLCGAKMLDPTSLKGCLRVKTWF